MEQLVYTDPAVISGKENLKIVYEFVADVRICGSMYQLCQYVMILGLPLVSSL